eukprot:1156061-Pelagomonas_calceolata.AAC.3
MVGEDGTPGSLLPRVSALVLSFDKAAYDYLKHQRLIVGLVMMELISSVVLLLMERVLACRSMVKAPSSSVLDTWLVKESQSFGTGMPLYAVKHGMSCKVGTETVLTCRTKAYNDFIPNVS